MFNICIISVYLWQVYCWIYGIVINVVQDGVDGIINYKHWTPVYVPLAGGNIPNLYTTTAQATTRSPRLPWLQDQEKREGEKVHDVITQMRVGLQGLRLLLIRDREAVKGRDAIKHNIQTTRSVRSTEWFLYYTRRQRKPMLISS